MKSIRILLAGLVPVLLCAQDAQFPENLATDAQLKIAANNLQTVLRGGITGPNDTVITVGDASRITPNMLLTIESEIVNVIAVNGNNLTVQRGFDGTTPARHIAGRIVAAYIDAWHHNSLKEEIKAIEAALGPGLSNIPTNQGRLTSGLFAFTPRVPGVPLTAGIINVVTLAPVPAGVNGTDTGHYLYISGGTGTAEAVLITGGTAVAGAPSGTVTFTPANAHSGAWTISSATGGIQEAICSLPAGGGDILVASDVTQLANVSNCGRTAITVLRKSGVTVSGNFTVFGGQFAASIPEQIITYPIASAGTPADLRSFGAVCNGNDINTAVQRALTAGVTNLFIPAGCKWVPPIGGNGLNHIPGGLHITGGNWDTAKIWPADVDTFMSLGPNTTLENVNTNGPLCFLRAAGCPVGIYTSNHLSIDVPVQNYPSNVVFVDTGSSAAPDRAGPYQANDMNGIVVINRGVGGGIYGQFNGGIGAASGSAVHAQQSATTGQGMLVTRTSTGVGQMWWDQAGAETGNTAIFTSSVKTGGMYMTMYHSTSNWVNGSGLTMNFGDAGGTFTGNFVNFQKAGVSKFAVGSDGKIRSPGITQASLGGDSGGTMVYCVDCAVNASACNPAGTGAWAFNTNGVWKCPF